MKGDYGTLVWVNDKEGHEFVCTVDHDHINERDFDKLSQKEKESCENVNQIVGTERW